MAGFHFISSNQQAVLLLKLVEKIQENKPRFEEQVRIIVENYGQQRWLSNNLAGNLEIFGNFKFFSISEYFELLIEENGILRGNKNDAINSEYWLFYTLLKSHSEKLPSELSSYLKECGDKDLYQFSQELCDYFKNYDLFEPHFFEQSYKQKENWQTFFLKQLPISYTRNRYSQILKGLTNQEKDFTAALKRNRNDIYLFGIPSIAPTYLNFLAAISESINIYYFYLNPCKSYWAENIREKTSTKAEIKKGISDSSQHFLLGNDLLKNFGSFGQKFIQEVLDKDLINLSQEYFKVPEPPSLLSKVKLDLLENENPSDSLSKQSNVDDSIQIHSCHSKLREVEVLKDFILRELNVGDIRPSDILVISPNLEEYSPYIDIVFNANTEVSFTGKGRNQSKRDSLKQYLFALFSLINSRFSVEDVFYFLECEAIRKKFRFNDESSIIAIRSYCEDCNVKWGMDENHRLQFLDKTSFENTWLEFTDKGLASFLFTEGTAELKSDEKSERLIDAQSFIDGQDAITFSQFIEFLNTLKRLSNQLRSIDFTRLSVSDWKKIINGILDQFFEFDLKYKNELRAIKRAILKIERSFEASEVGEVKIDLSLITFLLDSILVDFEKKKAFERLGVNFSSLSLSKGVPSKIIAVLGLEKGFPRSDFKESSLLNDKESLQNKLNRRDEDRYSFLELILNAGEKIYLSYVGQNRKDNSELSPSPLVTELIEYLEKYYLYSKENQNLVVKHSLQAFSPDSFKNNNLQSSFSAPDFEAAQNLLNKKNEPKERFLEGLRSSPEEKIIDLEDVVNFFVNPIKNYLNSGLRIHFEGNKEEINNDEEFSLSPLIFHQLGILLFQSKRENLNKEQIYQLAKSKGILTHGKKGELDFDSIYDDLSEFNDFLGEFTIEEEPIEYEFQQIVGEYTLKGKLTYQSDGKIVLVRPVKFNFKDKFSSWLIHLVVCSSKKLEKKLQVFLVGKKEFKRQLKSAAYTFLPVTDPLEKLDNLLSILYYDAEQPFEFFPRAALSYCEEIFEENQLKVGKKLKALSEAEKELYGQGEFLGEIRRNIYFKEFYEGVDVFSKTNFEKNIQLVLYDMFEHLQEI